MTRPSSFTAAMALLTLGVAMALSSCITCERCARKRAAAEAAAATGAAPAPAAASAGSPAATAAAPPAGQTAW